MFFERKAFFEFLDFTKIRITTPFKQKDFDIDLIKKDFIIDLIDLKIVPNKKNIKFYAIQDYTTKDEVGLLIYSNEELFIDCISFEKGSKLIKTKILEDD